MHRARYYFRILRTRAGCARRWTLVFFGAMIVLTSGCQQPTKPAPFPTRPGPQRPPTSPISGRTVVIDAGHGGKDTGAPGVGPLVEKYVNLAIAMRVADLLQQRGVNVVRTRRDDTFIPLDDRASTADRYAADLLVSIHADSAPNPRATGATIYIAGGATNQSKTAATRINASLSSAGIKTRGVRSAKFRVLVGHARPSVLVECGYLTNTVEASRLASGGYQARVAQAIATGVLDHLRALR